MRPRGYGCEKTVRIQALAGLARPGLPGQRSPNQDRLPANTDAANMREILAGLARRPGATALCGGTAAWGDGLARRPYLARQGLWALLGRIGGLGGCASPS